MQQQEYKHADLTQKIIGCAMKVHSQLGAGFPEVIYQRCLGIELAKANLLFAVEQSRDIFYQDNCVGSRRLDLLVEGKVLIELKAVTEIEPVFYVQVVNYLRVFELEVGLLLNFGKSSLEFKRLVNTRWS
ncbi:GxxExxY protein [Paraflavitalea speifideaquila]|uniref:GxxExxY protein n=1 Tax=Paraflavitalea speifideaquila TaxID=3076558 RepID=UPI0028EE0FE1|nr:GxxExxY protein [Paraflavitalea speifideiaquila]